MDYFFKKLVLLLATCLILSSVCVAKQETFDTDYDYDLNDPPENEEEEADVPLPVFKHKDAEIVVKEDETVIIDCTTKEATDHMLILKKGTAIVYVGNMKVPKQSKVQENKQVFTIPNVDKRDSGNYTCLFQNPEVKITYVVDVQFPPIVYTKTPKIQKVAKGESVTVKCKAKGNPKPVITWTRKDGRLPEEKGISMTMDNVDRHVEGTYICTADNGVGEPASSEMKVQVEYKPEIDTEKAIIRGENGEEKIELVCLVHSRPQAEVSWTKNEKPLENPKFVVKKENKGHRHSLIIPGDAEDKFGIYNCTATNEKGSATAEIDFTDLPKKPNFTSAESGSEDSSYVLTWETESFYPITEYIVKYRLVKANESTNLPGEWKEASVVATSENVESEGLLHKMQHSLDNLVPAANYQAVVVIKNKIKTSEEGEFDFSTKKETTSHNVEVSSSGLCRISLLVLMSTLFWSISS